MNRHHRLLALSLFIGAGLALSSCATTAGSAPAPAPMGAFLGDVEPAPPAGEVVGQGMVLDAEGDGPTLCLGGIRESHPPQCGGIPLAGWSWDGVDGSETANGVRWGSYAVQGTYDGETFTLTEEPILLALYDALPFPDPTDGKPGTADEATLVGIQDGLFDRLGPALLMAGVIDGYLWVDVVWDDGTLQQAADAEFGDDVVVIRSALRPVEG